MQWAAGLAWLWWLAAPLAATALVAVWAWWRARPPRTPTVKQTVRAHREFRDALGDATGDVTADGPAGRDHDRSDTHGRAG